MAFSPVIWRVLKAGLATAFLAPPLGAILAAWPVMLVTAGIMFPFVAAFAYFFAIVPAFLAGIVLGFATLKLRNPWLISAIGAVLGAGFSAIPAIAWYREIKQVWLSPGNPHWLIAYGAVVAAGVAWFLRHEGWIGRQAEPPGIVRGPENTGDAAA